MAKENIDIRDVEAAINAEKSIPQDVAKSVMDELRKVIEDEQRQKELNKKPTEKKENYVQLIVPDDLEKMYPGISLDLVDMCSVVIVRAGEDKSPQEINQAFEKALQRASLTIKDKDLPRTVPNVLPNCKGKMLQLPDGKKMSVKSKDAPLAVSVIKHKVDTTIG